jgi:hypothetical protein
LLSADRSKPDALAVIDVKRGSPTFSQVVHIVTMPHKGDAIDAIRKHKDTICVIALHLFGLDADCSKHNDGKYCYTRDNHKLLDVCLRRNIPLICWGDQPFRGSEKIPSYVTRTHIGGATCLMYTRGPGWK